MKINKLFVSNFKCIDSEGHIFDLHNSHTMLVGPNGYGKTTFFEAIEVLFTGRCDRIIKNETVSNDTKDYDKHPLLFEVGESEIFAEVIVGEEMWYYYRKYDDTTLSGKKNKAGNPYSQVGWKKQVGQNFDISLGSDYQTFMSDGSTFESIDRFHLFNYLQQEENLFFLKQSERARKGLIDKLFEEELTKYEKQSINLKSLRKSVEKFSGELENGQLKKVGDEKTELEERLGAKSYNNQLTAYTKLFKDKELPFDQNFDRNTPSLSKVEFQDYHIELDKLIHFKENFSLDEYGKKQKWEKLSSLETSEYKLLKYLTLRQYLESEDYRKNKEVHLLLSFKDQVIYKFLLQDINLDDFEGKVEYFESVKKYLTLDSLEDLYREYSPFKSLISNTDELEEVYHEYIQTKKQLSDGGRLVAKALQSRKVLREFEEGRKSKNKSKCFYCGHEHESPQEYYAHIQEMGEYIESSMVELNKKFEEVQNKLLAIFKALKGKLDEELKKEVNKIYTKDILQELKKLFKYSFPSSLEKYIQKMPWNWESIESRYVFLNMLESKTSTVKEQLKNIPEYNQDLFNACQYIEELKSDDTDYGIVFSSFDSNQEKKFESVFRENKRVLEIKKEKYRYDSSKVTRDHVAIFREYFDTNESNYKAISVSDIQKKKAYLDYIEHSQVRKRVLELNKQITLYKEQIHFAHEQSEKLKKQMTAINTAKKQFENEVWNQIEIPLNIFTAKLLKNHYQGKGVFIDKSKFISERDIGTDGQGQHHDIIHTFSTGQLAVVSLAFHLVIKKLFSKGHKLDFLCIDDPVQDLDVMNIHNLVELMRREIMDDNTQVIISTHNDDTAMYMNYKFGKSGHNMKILNMQKEMMR
jgi:exonuclease SbcC